MSEMLNNLPDVTFAEKDADEIVESIIAAYQTAAGVTLYPGDPVRLFLETIAYTIAYQRSLIDYTGKMNLLAYASGDYLDHIGALAGVSRLPAASAKCTVRFTISAEQEFNVIIPVGTRVANPDGLTFVSDEEAAIEAGDIYCDVTCTCATVGVGGNGLIAGQIASMVDPIAYVASAANTTTTSGGADIESDDGLRERIQLAPESFSVAGPKGAYVYWARTAHQNITSVAVDSPTPGIVNVYPLLAGGEIPGNEIIEDVETILNDETIRPLTDDVHVYAPTAENYSLNVTYYIARSNSTAAASIQAAVASAVSDWVAWQRAELGRDINPSELVHRMVAAGAKRVNITSPEYAEMAFNKVAVPTSQTVTFGGLEDG